MSRCENVLLPAQRTLHRPAYPKHAPPARHPSGVTRTGDPTAPAIPLGEHARAGGSGAFGTGSGRGGGMRATAAAVVVG